MKLNRPVILNISIFLALILLLEGVSFLLLQQRNNVTSCQNCAPRKADKNLHFWHPRDTSVQSSMSCRQESCFKEILYEFDEYGSRSHPSSNNSNKEVIFLGDSSLFGFGLPSEQTLPALFEKQTHFKTYNYGMSGAGLSHAFLLLKKRILSANHQQSAKVVLIITRAILNRHYPQLSNSFAWDNPYCRQEGTHWKCYLNVDELYPTIMKKLRFLNTLKKYSSFLKLIQFDHSPFEQEQQTIASAKLIKEIQKLTHSLFQQELTIIEHPKNGPDKEQRIILKREGISFLTIPSSTLASDYSDLCSCDTHPSFTANQYFAKELQKASKSWALPQK